MPAAAVWLVNLDTLRDKEGNEWQPFTNSYQQRQLRCIAGPREGDVIDDSRLVSEAGAGHSVSSRYPVQPARDPWLEGLFKSGFFD